MMLSLLVLTALLGAASSIEHPAKTHPKNDDNLSFQEAYRKFKPEMVRDGILTSGANEDAKKRSKLYKKAKRIVRKLNKESSSSGFEAELNEFCMLTDAEKNNFKGLNVSLVEAPEHTEELSEEEEVELQKRPFQRQASYRNWYPNYVTPVKHQQQCGSCWSFSGIAVLESRQAINGGRLVQMSEQEIIDCNSDGKECRGGWHSHVWKYVKAKGRVASAASYPYAKRKRYCQSYSKSNVLSRKITDYKSQTYKNSESTLQNLLASGPVSIAVHADTEMEYYSSGVRYDCLTKDINHAVVAVGYDSRVWLVRNSWGSSWGEGGYIRLGRGSCRNPNKYYSYYAGAPTLSRYQVEEEEEE